ncbi:uncharacterized protein LOC111637477 isoform X1 [Centruroides sculpturatus]|uniref:uncharacterized protein LOC111637477 isoform X1 n=1 Tax=Centruroides sculpturatus TaxID=218467 RepID=UPI000C6D32DC|nr:uncharacterized protein LOC111637477 isoform X1 [Centruroides sculpturatus]
MKDKLQVIFIIFILFQGSYGNQHRHHTEADCSRCPPGYRLIKRCSHGQDTECVPCEPHTYLPHHSYKYKCYPCSECGMGLYKAHECNSKRDTICDSCHTFKGPKNWNYFIRCAKFNENETEIQPSLARRTIPSTRQIGRLQHVDNTENEMTHASNAYLAMMLVGVGACALACLITGIVVYSWYGKKKWKDGSVYTYKNVNVEDPPKAP